MGLGSFLSCFGSHPRRHRRRKRHATRRSHISRTLQPNLAVRTGISSSSDRAFSSAGYSAYGSPRSAFSDDEFHDAVEDHTPWSVSSVSSRGSLDGPIAHHGTHRDTADADVDEEEEPTLLSRLADWWQDLVGTTSEDEEELPDQVSLGPAALPPAASLKHSSREVGSGSLGGGSKKVVELDDVAAPGCIGLLTATQVVLAQKKFLKLSRKPQAGSSFRRASESEAGAACGWEPADATTFLVRSQQYMRNGVKEPSAPSIYRLLGVDIFSFDSKVDHIAQRIELPPAPTLGPAAAALGPEKRIPPLLIVNLQLPTYAPSVFGSNDGPGQSLVYYFALPEGWEPDMVENRIALEMLQRCIANGTEADGQPTRDRLKLLPRIVNVDEWAIAGPLNGAEARLLRNYNGKPILTRPQHRFYSDPAGTYFEMDFDVHRYAYIARRAFYGYLTRLAPVIFENAFCLQGNRAEELPEVVLGAARVFRVDFMKSRPFSAEALDRVSMQSTGPESKAGG